MNRLAHTARRYIGKISSTIVNAARHFVPPKLSSWKLALYLIVFLLPGGSFAVLGMGWFENRNQRRATAASKPKQSSSHTLLPASCSGGGGAPGL